MLNKSVLRGLLAAAIFVFPVSNAISAGLSYNYVEATYGSITVDTGLSDDLEGTAIGVSGSFEVSPNIAVAAGYSQASYDRFFGIDFDSSAFVFGITAHTLVSPKTDINAGISMMSADVEASDGFTTVSDDDTGTVISIGLRHLISSSVELEAGFDQVDIFDDISNTVGFGARFYTSEQFSLAVGYTTGDDVDTYLLNARFDY